MKFTPQKSCRINRIQVKIRCHEVTTSGSGRDRSTRTATVLEKVHVLESDSQLNTGELFDHHYTVHFPATGPYSFERSDNKITWTAEVRIDIPTFPDWTHK